MRECVVPDYVAAFRDLGHYVGSLANIAANQKKCCMNVMAGQNIQQVQSMRIVGTVIEGKCHLLRPASSLAKSASEPLAGGSHGLISGRYHGGSSSSGERKHGGIVKEVRMQK
jgi:hypothetical protein